MRRYCTLKMQNQSQSWFDIWSNSGPISNDLEAIKDYETVWTLKSLNALRILYRLIGQIS